MSQADGELPSDQANESTLTHNSWTLQCAFCKGREPHSHVKISDPTDLKETPQGILGKMTVDCLTLDFDEGLDGEYDEFEGPNSETSDHPKAAADSDFEDSDFEDSDSEDSDSEGSDDHRATEDLGVSRDVSTSGGYDELIPDGLEFNDLDSSSCNSCEQCRASQEHAHAKGTAEGSKRTGLGIETRLAVDFQVKNGHMLKVGEILDDYMKAQFHKHIIRSTARGDYHYITIIDRADITSQTRLEMRVDAEDGQFPYDGYTTYFVPISDWDWKPTSGSSQDNEG